MASYKKHASKESRSWARPARTTYQQFFAVVFGSIPDVISSRTAMTTHTDASLSHNPTTHTVNSILLPHTDDADSLAWALTYRSMAHVTYSLIHTHPYVTHLNINNHSKKTLTTIGEKLDQNIQDFPTINEAFITNPVTTKLMIAVQQSLAQVLKKIGVNDGTTNSLIAAFPFHVIHQMFEEYGIFSTHYHKLPNTVTQYLSDTWAHYTAHLHKELNTPMLGGGVTLEQVYIPLRAYYETEVHHGHTTNPLLQSSHPHAKKTYQKTLVDATTHIYEWVQQSGGNDELRFVVGGSGSGKSSFMLTLAYTLNQQKKIHAIYIPLHEIPYTGNLVEDLDTNIASHSMFTHTRLLHGAYHSDGELIILLDGLDQLMVPHDNFVKKVRSITQQIAHITRDYNKEKVKIRFIVSCSDLSIQSVDRLFNPKQTIHLLPYYISEHQRKQHNYRDPHSMCEHDQRLLWWEKFGTISLNKTLTMPEALQTEPFNPITSNPLLNYVVAISLQNNCDTKKNKAEMNRYTHFNDMYSDMIDQACKTRAIATGVPESHYKRILEESAVVAWHQSGGLHMTDEHVRNALTQKQLDGIYDTIAQQEKYPLMFPGFTRNDDVRTDQRRFYHRSFAEYLVAKNIVRMLKRIHRKRDEHAHDPEEGWNKTTILSQWLVLFGGERLSRTISTFLYYEMMEESSETIHIWWDMIASYIQHVLLHGFPIPHGDISYPHLVTTTRNAEEALLVIMNVCARVFNTKLGTLKNDAKIMHIDFPNETTCYSWLIRLQGDMLQNLEILSFRSLSHLDLSHSFMITANLWRADLQHSKLSRGDFTGANFEGANLMYTQCQESIMEGVRLHQANIRSANFTQTDLTDAQFQGSVLMGSTMQGANLQGANLARVDLKGVNLTQANLAYANLENANLIGANLKGANLTNANLRGVNLKGVELQDVNLMGVSM